MSTKIDTTKMRNICVLDPGSGKTKGQLTRRSARSALVAISYDAYSRIFVRQTWADRKPVAVMEEKILDFNTRWKPYIFGIEANAQQSLYFSTLVDRMSQLRVCIPFHPLKPDVKVEKAWRIRTWLQPIIAEGRLFIPDTEYELRGEIQAFPTGETLDMVDALAYACSLVPPVRTATVIDEDREARLSYLREIDAPADIIEKVAAGEDYSEEYNYG